MEERGVEVRCVWRRIRYSKVRNLGVFSVQWVVFSFMEPQEKKNRISDDIEHSFERIGEKGIHHKEGGRDGRKMVEIHQVP